MGYKSYKIDKNYETIYYYLKSNGFSENVYNKSKEKRRIYKG